MSWLLLFTLTALVVLLPMLPAWLEWRWPSDVTPLHIDKDDALDPPFLARSFALGLSTALALGKSHLGRSPLVSLSSPPPGAPWPLDARETAAAASHKVWDVQGNAELPSGTAFLGEVASRASLRAAPGGLYRALWARDQLFLPGGCTVLRWAHATQLDVGPSCDLAGRISADAVISLAHGTRFVLLHAPVLRFAPGRTHRPADAVAAPEAVPARAGLGLPAAVVWHDASARGRCETALDIEGGRNWSGDLVCGADLHVGDGCQVQGSLKAHGRLTLGAGCRVHGSLVASGPITLGAGCTVQGSVVSETSVALGAACVIGLPGLPCTVAAPYVEVGGQVVAHGTVWASVEGFCNTAEASVPAAPAAASMPPMSPISSISPDAAPAAPALAPSLASSLAPAPSPSPATAPAQAATA